MGSSSSAVEVSQVFKSFLSNNVPSAETLDGTFLISISDDDFTQAVPLALVRDMRHLYTRNFALLLHHCIAQVVAMAKRRARTAIDSKELDSLVPRFYGALRILRRLIPVAFETSSIIRDFQAEAAPANASTGSRPDAPAAPTDAASASATARATGAEPRGARPSPTKATRNFVQSFFVLGKKCDDANPDATFPPIEGSPFPLGKLLVWSLVECCFIPGLTLPPNDLPATPEFSLTHPEVNLSLLWFPGIGCVDPFKKGPACKSNISVARKNVLQALLSALSFPLYCQAGARDKIFTEPVLSTIEMPLMPTLAASMLNTILHYEPYSMVPYASRFVNDEEKLVVTASCRVLCACLCYIGVPIEAMSVTTTPSMRRQHSMRTTTSGMLSESTTARHADPALKDDEDAHDKKEEAETVYVRDEAQEEQEKKKERKEKEEDAHPQDEKEKPTQPTPHEGDQGEEGAKRLPEVLKDRKASVQRVPPNLQEEIVGAETNPLQQQDSLTRHESGARLRGPLRLVHCVRKMMHDLTIMEAKEILTTLIKIIGLRSYASQTYLPDSQDSFTSEDEFMMLMWKLIDISPEMDVQFSNRTEVLRYLVPFLDYALDVRRKVRYINRLQLVVFILLRLSEMRGFGVLCNQPVKETISFSFPKLAPGATYNDVIITALCLIMESKETALTPIFTSCSVIVNNLSPFITSIGKITAVKLVNVFCAASQYCLARADDAGIIAQTVMVNTCEAIVGMLQYHESGSHYVIAALVDNREIIRRLHDAYLVSKTHTLRIQTTMPFLVDILAVAVSFVLPHVEALSSCPPMSGVVTVPGQPDAAKMLLVPSLTDNAEVMKKLDTLTLVGVLPTPHRIMVKRFQSTRSVELWALTVHWNTMFSCAKDGGFGDQISVMLLQFS
ncbi:hypothetical protein STCU_09266 [Strigomonas culicis]|uniref:Uncharacterized protein n=1 Tax=Strigomonas culicis TaxID=28005 RepID=S9UYY7_9TRYP|nr:hypothetical protein STCU_09266 [Strigomonas culicis]|eukprot:EPY19846.1 hypothetical protein STCU_09266 [Strigomonas culicis]